MSRILLEDSLCRSMKTILRASMVAQWRRIHLPVQEHRFDPWSREIPHPAEQLNPCTTSTEPMCCAAEAQLAPVLRRGWRNLCTTTKSGLRLLQLEKACTKHQRPNKTKHEIKYFKKIFKSFKAKFYFC